MTVASSLTFFVLAGLGHHLFATGAWLLMMIILMPLAGKGLFASSARPGIAIATLILYWIYGVALGAVIGVTRGSRAP